MAGRVVMHDVAISSLLYSPTSPVTVAIGRVAEFNVLREAQIALSRPWPGGSGPFPPPGPPYLRTGTLRDSLTVTFKNSGLRGPEWDIVPTAIKRGWNYGEVLQGRGYRFLPLRFYI